MVLDEPLRNATNVWDITTCPAQYAVCSMWLSLGFAFLSWRVVVQSVLSLLETLQEMTCWSTDMVQDLGKQVKALFIWYMLETASCEVIEDKCKCDVKPSGYCLTLAISWWTLWGEIKCGMTMVWLNDLRWCSDNWSRPRGWYYLIADLHNYLVNSVKTHICHHA